MRTKLKKSAFTLAEVLITLAIIGVVAVLVIPPLLNNINDNELKAAFRKNYATVAQAIALASVDYGDFTGLFTGGDYAARSYTMKEKLKPYFSYTKECNNIFTGGCWHQIGKFKFLNGVDVGLNDFGNSNPSGLILNNGVLLFFFSNNLDCDRVLGTSGYLSCGGITVDVNGFKGPNVFGKDIFGMHVLKNSIKPLGVKNDIANFVNCIEPPNTNWNTVTKNGWGCSAKYLMEQ